MHNKIQAGLIRKSKVYRSKSVREFSAIFPDEAIDRFCILSDEEAVAVKRIVDWRFLDFPGLSRGKVLKGSLNFGSPLTDTMIGDFLSYGSERNVYLFMEPWALHGAVVIDQELLEAYFWEIMSFCDYFVKFYNFEITRSCTLTEDDDAEAVAYSIAN